MGQENDWIEEVHDRNLKMGYRLEKRLFSKKSKFQKVEVVKTKPLGHMLLNDGIVMISEYDEFIYHDMIAHVPLFVHPKPRKVLIIGGGDGGTLREVLRHENIEAVTMVEIDQVVIDACKEFIPQTSSAMDNPRATVLVTDGVEYMATTKEKFDVIIVDSTDPIGPSTPLFGEAFYHDVYRVLSDDGIVVAQGESPHYKTKIQTAFLKIQNKIFPRCHLYNFSNMTYPGGLWSFTFSSKKYCPIGDFDSMRVENSKLEFLYYNSRIHKASFCLPSFLEKRLSNLLTPFQKSPL